MSQILDRLLALLARYLPSSAVPSRKVVAAGAVGPLVPIAVGLLKRLFPVWPRWLDFVISLIGGTFPVVAAYVVANKPVKPGTVKVV